MHIALHCVTDLRSFESVTKYLFEAGLVRQAIPSALFKDALIWLGQDPFQSVGKVNTNYGGNWCLCHTCLEENSDGNSFIYNDITFTIQRR